MKIYLVGGAVRDQLLARPVTERDWVVVGATPAQMCGLGYRQVGKDFPVFLHPQSNEEYALARTERKMGSGYTGFEVYAAPEVTLEQDLLRRDLTINAMAQDEDGVIVDPYGGMLDLQQRRLRHVSAAFAEDPLRVLRVARFAARYADLGFTVAGETIALMRDIAASGELSTLAPERVWTETQKALGEATPSVYFAILRQCDALVQLFPELDKLFGVPQRKDYHPEIDTGIHTLMVVDAAAKLQADLPTRFAALVHDLGKGLTPEQVLPSHHGHEKAGLPLIRQLCQRLKVQTNVQELALLVGEFHTHAHRALELRPATLVELLEKLDIFRRRERIAQFCLACKADSQGRTGYEEAAYPQADYLQQAAALCLEVDAKQFVAAGLQGKAIANAVRNTRIQRMQQLKDDGAGLLEPFDNS